MTCPWDQDRSLLTFPGLVPVGQVLYRQRACPTGTSTACPNLPVPQVVLVPVACPICICTCTCSFWYVIWLSLFHCLETQIQPRMLPLPPACLPLPRPPAQLLLPHLPWPQALCVGQSFRFLSASCWFKFFSVLIWLKSLSLFGNAGSTQNAASSSGLSSAASSSGPPSAASPALTSPSVGQSFRFLSACCWFFSVCCWLFVVLLLLSKISWICVGCWHMSLCVFMCRSCTPSSVGVKLSRMVDQSQDYISHTLWSVFVRGGASHVISADRKRL